MGSSVHEISQARLLEWVAMPSSRGSFPPRARTQVSHIAGGFFTAKPPGKPRIYIKLTFFFFTFICIYFLRHLFPGHKFLFLQFLLGYLFPLCNLLFWFRNNLFFFSKDHLNVAGRAHVLNWWWGLHNSVNVLSSIEMYSSIWLKNMFYIMWLILQ